MKLAAVIIENRFDIKKIADRHLKYLPGFELVHLKPNIKSLNGYNRYMTSMEFWSQVKDYDRILMFQHDSEILRNGIENFLHYDYIGAPWPWNDRGGNGGLSLRNPEKCIKLIEKKPWNINYGYEDVYFSNHLNGKVNTKKEGMRFSVETIFALGSFGAHAIDKYLTKEECKKIRNQYN